MKQRFEKLLWVLLPLLVVVGCKKNKEDDPNGNNPNPDGTSFAMGWNGGDDPSQIPSNIFLGLGGTGNMPSKYSMADKLPPVGDQGSYGTCVAWAAGYNLKTMLNAIDKKWDGVALANAQNQTSPKDLFLSIPASQRGTNCNGTNFEPAFNQMVSRGTASLRSSPYERMGDCSQSPDAGVASEASGNKLSNFRKVALDVTEIKTYISQNRPVVFGARLGDNFMTWRSDQVISSHSSFANVGQHATHAMMIIGYDDNKGPNGAFQVINSWGTVWGNKGFIWIDYNFMTNPQFGLMAFVATNGVSQDYNPVDPPDNNAAGDYDLVPWNVEDVQASSGGNKRRKMEYNIYNRGTKTIYASQRWSVVYLYYNAFDANDFGIMIYDEYSDKQGSLGQNGRLVSGGLGSIGNWWSYINLPGGKGVAEVMYNSSRMKWEYTMPNITGFYYLVSLADPFDVIKETDEANNYYFLTDKKGWPLYISNGVVQTVFGRQQSTELPPAGRKIDAPTPQELSGNRNAYTPDEIGNMLKTLKNNGKLKAAIDDFKAQRGIAE